MYREPRSRMWYVLPIFLGIIGGVIAWFALRSTDGALAKNCVIVGLISSLLSVTLSVLMGGFTVEPEPARLPWDQ